jgi:hypothetical protein
MQKKIIIKLNEIIFLRIFLSRNEYNTNIEIPANIAGTVALSAV